MAQIYSRRFGEDFGDHEMIDEGLLEMEQKKQDKETQRLLEGVITLAYNHSFEKMFDVLSYLVFNNEFQLESSELKEVVEKLYEITEGQWYEEQDGEETDYRKYRADTLERWQKIYKITKIDPPKNLTTSDITTLDGVYNILNNPDRIFFDWYKDDDEQIEKYRLNESWLEPRFFSHDVLLAKYSPEQIQKILFDTILYFEKREVSSNLYCIKEIKKLLPEFEFIIEEKKAKQFFGVFISNFIDTYKKYFDEPSVVRHGESQNFSSESFLWRVQNIEESLGISFDQISFDQKNIEQWYSFFHESFKIFNFVEKDFSEFIGIIALFEKFTHVPFDFSKYSEKIDSYYESEVQKLQKDREILAQDESSPEGYNLKRQGSSYVLDFYHRVESVAKSVKQSLPKFDEVLPQEICGEELQRLKAVVIHFSQDINNFSEQNLDHTLNCIDELQKRSDQELVYDEEEILAVNILLKEWCKKSEDLSSEYRVKKFESFVSFIEKISSQTFKTLIKKYGFLKDYNDIFFSLNSVNSVDTFLKRVFEKDEFQERLVRFVCYKIDGESFDLVFKVMSYFHITKEEIVQLRGEKFIQDGLNQVIKKDCEQAFEYSKMFELEENEVKQSALAAMFGELKSWGADRLDRVLKIKNHFKITREEFYQSANKGPLASEIFEFRGDNLVLLCDELIPTVFFETVYFQKFFRDRIVRDPRAFLQRCEQEKFFSSLFEKDPWFLGFLQIKKLQDISQNEKNDPWIFELKPLLDYVYKNNRVDIQNDKDIDLIVGYIKKFGMCNLKTVFSLYVACMRANSWADIPESIIAACEEYGIRVRKQNEEKSWRFAHPKLLLNELDKSLVTFQNELMADKIPENIYSTIGREQFSRMLGTTQWKREDSVVNLVDTWKQTIEKKPEAALLPKGYQESTFLCNEISRSVSTSEESQNIEEKLKEFFLSKEVQESYDPLAEAISVGLDKNVSERFWEMRQEAILNFLQQKIDEVDKFLKATPEQFDVWIEQEKNEELKASLTQKKKALSSERGRVGIEKQFIQMVELSKKIHDLSFVFESEEAVVKTLEQLAPIMESLTILGSLFREISALHLLRTTAHLNWGESLRESFGSALYPTPERISKLNSFLKQYVREHYLQKEQNQEHTSHIPFSETLRLALERIWKVQESRKGRIPLDGLEEKIEKIINFDRVVTLKQFEVSMVPVAGLLRIYSGDVGDACYTSRHGALARNEFPGLHAWIYVTKRGTSQETLCGSMLGIQTVQESGAPTLMARANNPKENFIQGIDSEAFAIASLKEVIETAKRIRLTRIEEAERQGILNVERRQCVVLPIDPVTASSTNREKVGKTYLRFHGLPKVGLRNHSETNFNNYENWDKRGDWPCSVIWEIDKDGKETYFGKWPQEG